MKLVVTLEKADGEVIDKFEIPSSIYSTYTDEELTGLVHEFMSDNAIDRGE